MQEELKINSLKHWSIQNKLTTELRKVSKALQNPDFVNIWAGQSVHDYNELSTEDILKKLIEDFELKILFD